MRIHFKVNQPASDCPGDRRVWNRAAQKQTILVPRPTPRHIVVILLPNRKRRSDYLWGRVGVLDIDSPIINRFDQLDQSGLEQFVKILESEIAWPDITD